jgi:polynucleotide 5'-hydroxyl-kinase GRC3/NOL9
MPGHLETGRTRIPQRVLEMPGKRKRDAVAPVVGSVSGRDSLQTITSDGKSDLHVDPANANSKPISAIAAARLKAAATDVSVNDEALDAPQSPLADASGSDCAVSEVEETGPIVTKNFRLCTWQNNGDNVLQDTEGSLTIVLEKHATVAFIGCCDVKVLKGAVNINGANLAAASRQEKKTKSQRVFASSFYPIMKMRGLDRTNHLQLLHCQEPTPFEKLSPLFKDIWAARSHFGRERSFHVVRPRSSFCITR